MPVIFLRPFKGVSGPGLLAETNFAKDGGSLAYLGVSSYPSVIYHSGQNKTWISREAWTGRLFSGRDIFVQTYDHATNTFSTVGRAGRTNLIDDTHGPPSIAIDSDGYAHVVFGGHFSNMRTADARSANDPLLWDAGPDFSGQFTYPHLMTIGSALWLYMRRTTGGNKKGTMRSTTSIVSGVPTWGSEVIFADPGGSDRFYAGTMLVNGTDIHMVATISNTANTIRRDVYYLIYDTTDGSVKNHDESFSTASGSLPIVRASLETNYRIIDMGTDTGWYHTLAFNTATGGPNVAYVEGTGSSFDIKHMFKSSLGAASWSTPQIVGNVEEDTAEVGLVPLPGGFFDLYWISDDGTYTRGGDLMKAHWTLGGGWESEVTFFEAGVRGINRQTTVIPAHSDARVSFMTVSIDQDDDNAGANDMYLYGDTGYLGRTIRSQTELDAIVAGFTVAPSDERQIEMDTLITTLKDQGVWDKLDCLYIFAVNDEDGSLINWIDPGTFDCTTSSTPVFVTDSGWDTDGVLDHIDSNFNPSTAGGNYTQNSAVFGIFLGTDGQTGGSVAGFKLSGSPGVTIQTRNTSNNVTARINQDATISDANTGSGAVQIAINRTASNAIQLYRDGIEVDTASTVSAAMANGSFLFGGIRSDSHQAITIRAGYAGGSLNADEHKALRISINPYIWAVVGSN